ncbi:MAG: hypothetical protein WCP46_05500 [Alphaproteobacteria bacterium]
MDQNLLLAAEKQISSTDFNGRLRICAFANNELAMSAYERFEFDWYEIIFEKQVIVLNSKF